MNTFEPDPLKRFSDRVDNYIKYRPGYPQEVIDFINSRLNVLPGSKIADVGSGTGIFSGLLLRNNYLVYGVEPNKEMREAAENLLAGNKNFTSIDGTSEATGLGNKSMDAVTSAQAFHWFRPEQTRAEFKRILKDNAYVILIWNSRINESSAFMQEYESLLMSLSVDYNLVKHTNINKDTFDKFYSSYDKVNFNNRQTFDYEGLKGRLLSSSYAPAENMPGHIPMMSHLEEIFKRHENEGKVDFIYNTEVYFGKL